MDQSSVKVGFVSLGCPKNATDTEVMLGLLSEAGMTITSDPDQADLCLVNTCSFVDDARKESVRTLVELAHQGKELIIAGCLAQHFKDELLKEIPEARAIIGTRDIDKIVDVVETISKDPLVRVRAVSDIPNDYSDAVLPRLSTNAGAFGYLKIAEGCDHNCSFCIIPMLRGRFRSRSIESLVDEAKVLVAGGVKEIILVSQDSTYYGLDLYGRMALPELLNRLAEIEGLSWIRIMYFYPSETTEALLKEIARIDKVVNYVDIPLQHSHPAILSAMARPQHPQKVITRVRELIPDVRIRSTFIVGFPGENEEHFEHLHDFVQKHRLDRLGVFTYSKENEVPSGSMPDQVPEKTKRKRRHQLMQTQQKIATELNQNLVGAELSVLIESFDASTNLYCGRTQWDAPEVDNQVYVKDPNEDLVTLGDFVTVKIEQAKSYDLFGAAITKT